MNHPSPPAPLPSTGEGGCVPARRRRTIFAALLFALPAYAHDLQHEVDSAQAVVVTLHFTDAKPFSFEAYEIYRQGEKLPVQVGRSDAQGRIAFLPDRAGTWRIKTFAADGHGLDFTVQTDAATRVVAAERPAVERYGRIVVGIGVILGLFGFIKLFLRKK